MKIFISGGTGFIGSYLRMMLLQQGHLLTLVTRDPGKYASETAQNQEFVSWDDDLVNAIEQADAVINLAGSSIFGQRWTEEVKQRIYESRIESTRHIVEAIKAASEPPSVLVSASAAGYYGDRGDDVLDESEEPGNDFLANVCVDWEKEAQKVTEDAVRLAIPRIGIVLQRDGGAMEQMLPAFKCFVGGPVGSGKQYFPWIHMHDLCRGILFAIQEEQMEGPFNLNAPNPVTMGAFANELGSQLHRPSFMKVPEFALKLVLGDAAAPITNSLRLQPKKLQQHGFEFQYPHLVSAFGDIL
ncbi:TIGR01777 family oxidoreductase [Fodinibius salsisoli]|uniref:TIGR01777 family oxidoreductase n=1 Tax=Fodinibius salsisoli TaxID=2820877 RepID=A0ABT3PRV2_9BACT|nr:TIGR01777 family oxidoreductase [Fodinibius salsisoli]MCW9708588.1 TIGR01777 family oxidoreductase [Fodinibius salsisoli]